MIVKTIILLIGSFSLFGCGDIEREEEPIVELEHTRDGDGYWELLTSPTGKTWDCFIINGNREAAMHCEVRE